jgi:hypothetical protein
MVTAETAMALPVLAVVLGMCLWLISVAAAQVRCADAAYSAARAAARGEPPAAVEAAALAAVPAGSSVEIERVADRIQVTVRARAAPGRGPLGALPAITVTGVAVAAVERTASIPAP